MDNQNIAPAIHERKGHTPGPWEVKDSYDGLRVIHYLGMGSNQVICHVDPAKTPAQRVANARLIAAAPELLEALKSLVNSLADNDEDGMTEFSDDMVRARAAITKAEG